MGTRSLVSRLPRLLWMDASTVAREGYEAVMEGRTVYVNGIVNQSLSQMMSHLPLSLKQFLAKQQERLPL